MTEYPQYPTEPTPQSGYGAPPADRRPRPASVSLAVKLIWVGIALSLLSAVITFVVLDDLVDAALDQPAARGVPEDTIRASVIGGIVVGLVIGVGLNVLLATFINKGASWARITYTVLGALAIVFGLLGLSGNAAGPAVLTVLSVVSMLLTAVVLFLLWKKDSAAWFKRPRFPVA